MKSTTRNAPMPICIQPCEVESASMCTKTTVALEPLLGMEAFSMRYLANDADTTAIGNPVSMTSNGAPCERS